jgi:four helix bundle protein
MKIESFEDILAWQKAKKLTVDVYDICRELKDYGFRDQLQRAAVSVMNNIAEGFERQSNKEFKYFLYVAKGSSGEVRSMVHLAQELAYFDESTSQNLTHQATEVSKLLSGFIKRL